MWGLTTTMPENGDAWQPVPQLMTQDELVRFLRIPKISAARDQHNVIEHLKRCPSGKLYHDEYAKPKPARAEFTDPY
jgi:hypothetical protein